MNRYIDLASRWRHLEKGSKRENGYEIGRANCLIRCAAELEAIVPEWRVHRNNHQYLSDRLVPLLYWGPPPEVPTLTVEVSETWYELWLVQTNGDVTKVDWAILEDLCEPSKELSSAWHDHAPNPLVVQKLCEKNEWWFHDVARELMEARF